MRVARFLAHSGTYARRSLLSFPVRQASLERRYAFRRLDRTHRLPGRQHVEDDGFPQEADGPSRRHARRSRPRLPYDDRPRKGDQSVSRLKGFKNIDGERGDVVGAAPPASVALLGRNELYRDIGRRKSVRPENVARRVIKYFF